MPELPEVETVRAGLEQILRDHPIIEKIELRRPDIRFVIPKELPETLRGARIMGVRRRAKYLLIDTDQGVLLSHLGMTGSWRVLKTSEAADIHDHCYVYLSGGVKLGFRDPRRFGMIDLILIGQETEHPRLKDLGPEPLDIEKFTAPILFSQSRKRTIPIKAFIMDQKIVVGVGNIYASEALFRAFIRPSRAAGRLSKIEAERLVDACRTILLESIKAGGSSIRDYKNADGESGAFQDAHLVYNRSGEACRVCKAEIKSKVIGGRSTFWCPQCQR